MLVIQCAVGGKNLVVRVKLCAVGFDCVVVKLERSHFLKKFVFVIVSLRRSLAMFDERVSHKGRPLFSVKFLIDWSLFQSDVNDPSIILVQSSRRRPRTKEDATIFI